MAGVSKKGGKLQALKPSLAGTGSPYVCMQGKIPDGPVLHLQGAGPGANREYGISANVRVSDTLAKWFGTLDRPLLSLTGSTELYVPMRARHNSQKGVVHFQIPGPVYNREYGAAFDIAEAKCLELANWLDLAPADLSSVAKAIKSSGE